MKKSLLAILFASFALVANAQWYVGGSLGVTHSSIDVNGNDMGGTSFKIIPEVGYQLSDNWSVGISVGYSHGYAALGSFDVNDVKALANSIVSTALDVASDDGVGLKLNAFRVAPYARYNVATVGMVQFFLEGAVGFSSIKIDNGDNARTSQYAKDPSVTLLEFCIKPGIALNVSDHAQIIAKIGSLGYQNAKLDIGAPTKPSISRFGFDVDSNNLLLGFNYRF